MPAKKQVSASQNRLKTLNFTPFLAIIRCREIEILGMRQYPTLRKSVARLAYRSRMQPSVGEARSPRLGEGPGHDR